MFYMESSDLNLSKPPQFVKEHIVTSFLASSELSADQSRTVDMGLKGVGLVFGALGDKGAQTGYNEKAIRVQWMKNQLPKLDTPPSTSSPEIETPSQPAPGVDRVLDAFQEVIGKKFAEEAALVTPIALAKPVYNLVGAPEVQKKEMADTLKKINLLGQSSTGIDVIKLLQSEDQVKEKTPVERRQYYLKLAKGLTDLTMAALDNLRKVSMTPVKGALETQAGVQVEQLLPPLTEGLRSYLPQPLTLALKKVELSVLDPRFILVLKVISQSMGWATFISGSSKPTEIATHFERSFLNESLDTGYKRLMENSLRVMDSVQEAYMGILKDKDKLEVSDRLIEITKFAKGGIKSANNAYALAQVVQEYIHDVSELLPGEEIQETLALLRNECGLFCSLETLREESVRNRLQQLLEKEVDIGSPSTALTTSQLKKAKKLLFELSPGSTGRPPFVQGMSMSQRLTFFRKADALLANPKQERLSQSLGIKASFKELHENARDFFKDQPKQVQDRLGKVDNYSQLHAFLEEFSPFPIESRQKAVGDLKELCGKFKEIEGLRKERALTDLRKMKKLTDHEKTQAKIQSLIDRLNEGFDQLSIQEREVVFKKVADLMK